MLLQFQTLIANMMKLTKQTTFLDKIKDGSSIPPELLNRVKRTANNIVDRLYAAINDPNSYHYESKPGVYDILGLEPTDSMTCIPDKKEQVDSPYPPTKKIKTEDDNTISMTNINLGMIKIEKKDTKKVPNVDAINVRQPHLHISAKICPYFVIKGKQCHYKLSCNKVHLS